MTPKAEGSIGAAQLRRARAVPAAWEAMKKELPPRQAPRICRRIFRHPRVSLRKLRSEPSSQTPFGRILRIPLEWTIVASTQYLGMFA